MNKDVISDAERAMDSLKLKNNDLQEIINFKSSITFRVIKELFEIEKKQAFKTLMSVNVENNTLPFIGVVAELRGRQKMLNNLIRLSDRAEKKMKARLGKDK